MRYSVEVRHVAPTVVQVWAYEVEAGSEAEATVEALERHESNLEWQAAMSGEMIQQTARSPEPWHSLGYSVQGVRQTQD